METLNIQTRVTLFAKMKQQDEESWNEFFRIYGDMARHWAAGFRCAPSQLDDIIQDSMIRMMQILPSIDFDRRPGSLRALLKKIVWGKVCDASRRQGVFLQESNTFFEKYAERTEETESEDDLAFLSALLRSAFKCTSRKVEENTYKAFCMYVLDSLPPDEVCRRLGNNMKPGALYQLKSRFLQMLEKEFSILLAEHGLGEDSAVGGKKFIKILDAFLNGQRCYRNTILVDFVADKVPHHRDLSPPVEPASKAFRLPCIGISIPGKDMQSYSLDKRLLLGKNPDCDIVVDLPGISGIHMEFCMENELCRVTDLASANGVLVNRQKLDITSLEADGTVIGLPGETLVIILLNPDSGISNTHSKRMRI